MKPRVLVITPITELSHRHLDEAYDLHVEEDPIARAEYIAAEGANINVIVTEGPRQLDEDTLKSMPNLELICAMSVGLDGFDITVAKDQGIKVTNGTGANAESVADLAIGLMIGVSRRFIENHAAMQASAGDEHINRPMTITINGKNLGIIGLGDIGKRVAQRAEAFGMTIHYHNRNRRDDVTYNFCETPEDLAATSDILAICCPATSETNNLVNAEVLGAMPPNGIVVNVSRGSVVDSVALLNALDIGHLWGAGLDVVAGDDTTKALLVARPNVLATPHIAGHTFEARENKNALMREVLRAHFAGEELPNRVI